MEIVKQENLQFWGDEELVDTPFLAVAPEHACRASSRTTEGLGSVFVSSLQSRWYAAAIPA